MDEQDIGWRNGCSANEDFGGNRANVADFCSRPSYLKTINYHHLGISGHAYGVN
jgi:hypothetical protein